jgi:capsule polysaccharide modification protein KpsS
MQSFFPNHFMILNDLKDIGKFDKNIIANKDLSQFLFPSTQALFFKLFLRYLTLQKFYMSIKVEKNAYKAFYALRHWKYQKIYNQKTNQFTIPNKYIYFPLNLQPEMTTDILGVHENGEDYANHIHVLQKILSLLPDDMKIIVKENPKQTVYARSKFFFQYIETYKDLIMLVPTTVSSHELIQKSQAIITTSGTSGFEAIQYRKPVICFGLAWYRKLHGVFDGNNLSNIDDILNFRYNEQVLQKDINALFSTFHEGIVDHGYSVLVDNFTIAENLKKVCHALIQHIKAN